MNANVLILFRSCRWWLVLGVLLAGNSLSALTEDQLRITSIRLEGTNVVVTARVPDGLRRVTLESRARLGTGSWEPRAIARLDGAGGDVIFQVSRTTTLEMLRVRAMDQEPLPTSFYTGTNVFLGQPVTSPGWNGLTTLAPGGDATAGTDSREVIESDIWKISGDTLYFFNQYRGLQLIDITNPDAAVVKGVLPMPAVGEQMYLLDTNHVALLVRDGCHWWGADSESRVLIVNVENGAPNIVAGCLVQGLIQESRLVGTALYVASLTYRVRTNDASSVTWEIGTLVSSFDLSHPETPVTRDTLWFTGSDNTVAATDVFLFVAVTSPSDYWRSIVHCLDITSPDGTMNDFASIATAGRIKDKFKLNLDGSMFTAVSEVPATSGGTWFTKLETFHLPDPRSTGLEGVRKLGQLALGEGQRVYATRFDGNLVYVVTYRRIDPLWVVDLSDPANPKLAGELHVPGYSTFIQPLGDRLVTVGIDDTNSWRVAVSLFDVHDPSAPALLSKVILGQNYSWSEANTDEKAFNVMPDEHLVLLPYQGYLTNGYAQRIQLIDLHRDSLAVRGVIEHQFQPRRATVHNDRIVSISGQELLSVDATDRDQPLVKAALPLAWSADQLFVQGPYLIQLSAPSSWWWSGQPTPAIRVTLANEPDHVLSEMDLPVQLPIMGASIRGGRLYLAQAQQSYGPVLLAGESSDPSQPTNPPPNLFLSVYDVSALPEFTMLGEANVTLEPIGWISSYQLVWPKPSVLVLAGGSSSYWYYWYPGLDGSLNGPASGFAPTIYSGKPGGRLVAFDVSDATAPGLLSDVILCTNQSRSYGPAFTADSLVYLSHQAFLPGPLDYDSSGSNTNSTPQYWVQRSFLDVVDYADAVNPTVRKPVNIPGLLEGVASGGELLYTVGGHWTNPTNGWWDGSQYLDASAYDGLKAHLVDSLALPKTWPHPVLVQDNRIFLGRPAESSNSADQLESWTLSTGGRFTQLGRADLSGPAQSFLALENLLAVQINSTVSLFNVEVPKRPIFLNNGPTSSCILFDLSKADGALDRGIWLPLGVYGVSTVPIVPP